jgi:hypothetical protein
MDTLRRSAPRRTHHPVWERAWSVAAGAAIAVGLWLELRQVSAGLVVAVLGLLMAMAAICAWALRDEFPRSARWIMRLVPSVSLGMLVVLGLARAGSAIAVAVMITLLVTCPDLYHPRALLEAGGRAPRRTFSWRGARSRPATPPTGPPTRADWPPAPIEDEEPLVVPDALGIDDLTRAWCSSYVALEHADSPAARARIAEARAACLDALEREDRSAFVAWLDHGARPASDPSRWFTKRAQ